MHRGRKTRVGGCLGQSLWLDLVGVEVDGGGLLVEVNLDGGP